MTGQAPNNTPNPLDDIRADIDAIDRGIFDLLVRRSARVSDVARAKSEFADRVPLRPLREASQMMSLMDWHKEAGLDYPQVSVLAIWREIIGASIAQQGGMVIVTTPDGLAAARAYFGSALTYNCVPSEAEVLSAAIALDAVGVVGIDTYPEWYDKVPEGGSFFARLSVVDADNFICFGKLSEEDMDAYRNLKVTYLLEGAVETRHGDTGSEVQVLSKKDDICLFSAVQPLAGYRRLGYFVCFDLNEDQHDRS